MALVMRTVRGWQAEWGAMSPLRRARRVGMLGLLGVGIWALSLYLYSRTVNDTFPAVSQVSQSGEQAESGAGQVIARGNFSGADPVHQVSGTATVYRLPTGAHLLRLEGFRSTNGPDLFVGLSGHRMPRTSAELHDQGYHQVLALKASQGNQNYELPSGIDIDTFKSVVIYCRAFKLTFGSAELQP